MGRPRTGEQSVRGGMRLSDFLENVGHPVAYYPALAAPLGSVNAAVLFCQLYYWTKRSTNELGVHKTVEELTYETGMSRAEQETARRALKKCGVLIETYRRIEHKLYYRLDIDMLEALLEPRNEAAADADRSESGKAAFPKARFQRSGERESSIRESGIPALGKAENSRSRALKTCTPEAANPAFVNNGKTTTEITTESSSNAYAREAVDNFATAADYSNREQPLADTVFSRLLIDLERDRGKVLAIDRSRDRVHVLSWVGRELSVDQLRAAHALAVAARKRDNDDRPTYVGFVTEFVDQVLALTPRSAHTVADGDRIAWYETPNGVDVCANQAGMRLRRPNEDWRHYRVVVANAVRDRAAVAFILKDAQRFNAIDLYKFARDTFGDALMPMDDYAS
jgi:hypothetical protein